MQITQEQSDELETLFEAAHAAEEEKVAACMMNDWDRIKPAMQRVDEARGAFRVAVVNIMKTKLADAFADYIIAMRPMLEAYESAAEAADWLRRNGINPGNGTAAWLKEVKIPPPTAAARDCHDGCRAPDFKKLDTSQLLTPEADALFKGNYRLPDDHELYQGPQGNYF